MKYVQNENLLNHQSSEPITVKLEWNDETKKILSEVMSHYLQGHYYDSRGYELIGNESYLLDLKDSDANFEKLIEDFLDMRDLGKPFFLTLIQNDFIEITFITPGSQQSLLSLVKVSSKKRCMRALIENIEMNKETRRN
ncbi:MAG: hypothetical protein KA715_12210 [Xanthomonadaceae bacterium]|nr:hypothetical protein [Xanthomonadaceae bacterium]